MQKTLILVSFFLFFYGALYSQHPGDPVVMRQSEDFETPGRHFLLSPIPWGEQGIIQFSQRGMKSIHTQHFSNELRLLKERDFEPEDKFSEKVSDNKVIRMKDRIFLLAREVFKEDKTEGVAALEFFPDKLSFEAKSKKLFKSSDKVVRWSGNPFYLSSARTVGDMGPYEITLSENQTNLLLTYRLVPEKRNDKESTDIIGMYVFDNGMNKVWGKEVKMPYTEAKMDNMSYAVTEDGKVYLLAKVYEGDSPEEGRRRKEPNYHFEVLIYDGKSDKAEKLEVKLNGFVPRSLSIFETPKGEILLTGFYAKDLRKPADGAFVLELDPARKSTSLKNGGIFEIPSEIIKSFTSGREKRRLERQENRDDENDLGVESLTSRCIHILPDGTLKFIAEQYRVETIRNTVNTKGGGSTTYYTYHTYADDIFVINAQPGGEFWVQKIPKSQHSTDAYGPELSFNSMVNKDDLYIFYVDNKKNKDLPVNEAPKTHQQGKGGYLTCVKLDARGSQQKSYLGEIDDFETNFHIRYFVEGDQNNLVYTARKRKKNSIISLDIR